MDLRTAVRNTGKIAELIEPTLRLARIPGAAIAVVLQGTTVFARAFGYADLKRKAPLTAKTFYPIASTTKAMNALLLGMLVDEGRIAWDAPVQKYLPCFRLRDEVLSSRVTVRDLVTMRTGLPRHDWVWTGSNINRATLVERLAHLDFSADLRQRFQYCNLSVTAAGHIAEVVMGESWESLIRERIFRPLGMRATRCGRPSTSNVTLSYHENIRGRLLVSTRLASESTAPSGGAVYSTLMDMCRWVAFNLNGGAIGRRRLVSAKTFAEIQSPQIVIGDRPLARLPAHANYALGWLVDSHKGHRRLSHVGYIHDLNSSVMLFPDAGVGLVSFINFGCCNIADLMNQCAFEVLCGRNANHALEEALTQYEARKSSNRDRIGAVARTLNTRPSQPLAAYQGKYRHPGYGDVLIAKIGNRLALRRNGLTVALRHWHYDVWVPEASDRWVVHVPHAFDQSSHFQFQCDAGGRIASLSIALEPEVKPICFAKQATQG